MLLDFKSAIAFDLVEALSRDGYNTPDRIMECIFSFAKEVNEYGTNPTGGLSATWALRNGRRTLREFILNYIPSYFAKSLREAVAFSARDLG